MEESSSPSAQPKISFSSFPWSCLWGVPGPRGRRTGHSELSSWRRPCAGSGLGLARFRPRAVRQGLAKRLAEADFGVWAKRRRGGGEHRHVSAGVHRVVTRLTPVTRLEATCSRSGDPESLGVGPGDPTPAPRAGVSVGFGSTDAVPPPLLTNEDRLFLPQVPPSRGKLFSAGE